MYDFFQGVVANIDTAGFCSLNVNGVGYHLRISEETRRRIPLDGSSVTLHARLVVRDDDLMLFGFHDPAERAAFDLLTSVQGVGPAVAMNLLSACSVGELRQVLLRRDVGALRRIKGVGPKTAERLALELHDKIERIPAPREDLPATEAAPADDAADEARKALVALGFANRDAMDALAKAARPGASAEELLRRALALLR